MNRKTIRRQLFFFSLTALFLFVRELPAWRMNAAYILPSPTRILRRIYELRGPLLLARLLVTMTAVAVLLLLSLLLGTFFATLMDQGKTAERAPCPLLVASQTISTTTLAPLFVLWLGYSTWSKMFATMFMTFFPVMVMFSDGFRVIPSEMTELMQTLDVTRWRLFRKLKLPAMSPSFFTVIRMVVPLPVIGAAIDERLGAQAGPGYFSRRMMTQPDDAGAFTPVVPLSAAAMLLMAPVRQIETKAFRFRNHQDSDKEETRRKNS